MTEKVTEKKRHKSPGKPGRYVYGGGLWMDEMVDKMMEQESSGYVGFHCTYKKDLGKQTPGTEKEASFQMAGKSRLFYCLLSRHPNGQIAKHRVSVHREKRY